MRINLIRLLRDCPIIHPSRIVSVAITKPRELHVRVAGYPWWSVGADRTRDHEITFTFGGISTGVLELPDFDFEEIEALEEFSVEEAVNVPWAQPDGYQIYCRAPLARPMDIYLIVHDFLVSHGAFHRAEQLLNCGDSELLESFVEITQNTSYLVGTVPKALCGLICSELDAQRVPHNELPTRLTKPDLLLTTIQRSQFFCQTAEAEFQK